MLINPIPPPKLGTGHWLRLFVILAVALGLRVWALTWGMPGPNRNDSLHPDEGPGIATMIQLLADPMMHGPTNKFAFKKGAGYFYSGMLALRAGLRLQWIQIDSSGQPKDLTSWRRIFLLARTVSVLFSLGTIVFAYLCGRRLFGPLVGELAAGLEAISPLAVVNAHWATPDCGHAFWIMVCLYLAARSARDWRWLLGAMFSAGLAGSFKYPGASALILVFTAALFLDAEHRSRRVTLTVLALPLFFAGFLLGFPALVAEPASLKWGLSIDQGMTSTGFSESFRHLVLYPWYLAKTTGLVFPLWGLAALIYSFLRPRREAWIILCWLLPYATIMASSWFVVTRYALPWVSALGLLMARMAQELIERTQPRLRPWTIAGFSLAGLLLLAPTCFHLRTMSRPDPRDLAAAWIRSQVPLHTAVAITPSFNNDRFFVVTLDPEAYQIIPLSFRNDQDASSYPAKPFHLLAANERAWAQGFLPRPPSQTLFWKQVMESKNWELLARFSNRPAWPGLFLHGQLPEDFSYLYQETRIYRRNY